MVMLIKVDDVRNRLALPDDDGINASIQSAMESAHEQAATLLMTSFDTGETTDYFLIDPVVETTVGGFYLLRLNNGFVQSLDWVRYGLEVGSVSEEVTGYLADNARGWVKVPFGYAGMVIGVKYSYGLEDYTACPPWLKEVLIGLTIKTMSAQQISDGKPELSSMAASVDGVVGAILARRTRGASSSIAPLV